MAAKERQRKTVDPCPTCGLNRTLCLCDLIPSLDLRTHLTLVIHAKELKRTTNSGRLAIHALKNSDMVIRGAREDRESGTDLSSKLLDGYHPLFFYPADGAVELTREFIATLTKPVQLLVPDGNWRQASKVYSRHPELAGVTCVKISTPNEATTHLRAEHMPEGMSTLEAIAKAFGVIEGFEAERPLLALYQEKLRRTLLGRGVK